MTPNPAPPWPRPDRPYPAHYRQDQPTVQVRRHMPALSRARPTPSFHQPPLTACDNGNRPGTLRTPAVTPAPSAAPPRPGNRGARLAGMLGWQQSKVSKIETRKQLPSEDDITAWAGAVGATPGPAVFRRTSWNSKRMQRQQVLYQHGKQVTVVMLEGALRARVVSVPTLAGQLDRLMAVSGLASLELCIIPFEAAVPVFPLSGFRLYDDLVIVESIVGEQQLAEADDVARYEKYLELLRDAASTGTEAAAVIRRSLESLR